MAVEIKQQKLLSKKKIKKAVPGGKAVDPRVLAQQKKFEQERLALENEIIAAKKKRSLKIKLSILGVLGFAFLITPKPQLIKYEKLDLVTTSVYWPGFTESQSMLLDSKQQIIVDDELSVVYLCYGNQSKDNCQRYRLLEREGLISAVKHLITN